MLYDERAGSAGVKFNPADLLGLPLRVVVSTRSRISSGVELKLCKQRMSRIVPLPEAIRAMEEEVTGGVTERR